MRRARRVLGAVLLGALALGGAPFAAADLFSGFYTAQSQPKRPAEKPRIEPSISGMCIAAILEAQANHAIPDNLLLSIGIQEAGRSGPQGLTVWPWTVNAAGEGAFFQSRQAALDWVREKQAAGIDSIDVGCMQINLRWHGAEFATQEAAFDPHLNADYAARFLRALFEKTGSWDEAAGRYHSATDVHQQRYLSSLQRNTAVVAKHFDRLAALAHSAAPVAVAQTEPAAPTPAVFWGGGGQGSQYSIYSNTPLQAVLPKYREMF
ncbi:transglycosylase SLT domain-containing protein [Cognatishimia sp. SS12]|uniref:transglycosylase SLT domain-containing protein n=1 Tax=Cognatishimia sp. SS12 TaxID=2979465 RepID=UPI00232EBB23|nr:transglycosylase SLT domain-containing protein [Cognatishimia sp. SS12]MDC0739476.1 transglycosylase SLT domain-containing protein [Cognatishimia sp. SS12]